MMQINILNSEQSRPILEDHGFAIVRKVAIGTLVSVLNIFRRLPDVRGLALRLAFVAVAASVTAFGVDAVKSVLLRRSGPNVSKEIFVGLSPAMADVSSFGPVVFEVVGVRVVAAVNHQAMNVPFSLVRMAVRDLRSASANVEGIGAIQVIGKYPADLAADAQAFPFCATVQFLAWADNGNRAVFLPDAVFEAVTLADTFRGSHEILLLNQGDLWIGSAGASTPSDPFIIAV